MSVENLTDNNEFKSRTWVSPHDCAVCGAKAIGINFGAPTCAPCKAFFRRNARRREILQSPCQVIESDRSITNLKDQNDNIDICPQLRRCTSCRLRRCFEIGMKEELVRTDEEKLRYRLLIECNRQRRNEILKSRQNLRTIPPTVVSANHLLEEKDWTYLSNIVAAYDNYCLKSFRDNRQQIFLNPFKSSDSSLTKIHHHTTTRLNNITSFLSFLTSIPVICSLTYIERYYQSKHNIRPLILLNLHELDQTCFTESWQANVDNEAAECVYGPELYFNTLQIRKRAESILINDPVITRLWLVILFFSSPLSCYYDQTSTDLFNQIHLNFTKIQNTFCTLLWNYLLHRHGYVDTIRIFSNTIRIYLQMQQLSRSISHQVRTRDDLKIMNQRMNQVILLQNQLCDKEKTELML